MMQYNPSYTSPMNSSWTPSPGSVPNTDLFGSRPSSSSPNPQRQIQVNSTIDADIGT